MGFDNAVKLLDNIELFDRGGKIPYQLFGKRVYKP